MRIRCMVYNNAFSKRKNPVNKTETMRKILKEKLVTFKSVSFLLHMSIYIVVHFIITCRIFDYLPTNLSFRIHKY